MQNDAIDLFGMERDALVKHIVQRVTDAHREYHDTDVCLDLLHMYIATVRTRYSPEAAAEVRLLALQLLVPLLCRIEGPSRNSPMTPIGHE